MHVEMFTHCHDAGSFNAALFNPASIKSEFTELSCKDESIAFLHRVCLGKCIAYEVMHY